MFLNINYNVQSLLNMTFYSAFYETEYLNNTIQNDFSKPKTDVSFTYRRFSLLL